MSSPEDFLPLSNSLTFPTSTSDSLPPASYVQIQNELTPARSPGSCKVRFSEKTRKSNSTINQLGDLNESLLLESNATYNNDKHSKRPSPPIHHIEQNTLSYNPRSPNGIIPG